MADQLSANDEVLGLFRNDARISAVFLHGSFARGEARNETHARMMTMHLLSMYAAFNEDRREIIAAWTA